MTPTLPQVKGPPPPVTPSREGLFAEHFRRTAAAEALVSEARKFLQVVLAANGDTRPIPFEALALPDVRDGETARLPLNKLASALASNDWDRHVMVKKWFHRTMDRLVRDNRLGVADYEAATATAICSYVLTKSSVAVGDWQASGGRMERQFVETLHQEHHEHTMVGCRAYPLPVPFWMPQRAHRIVEAASPRIRDKLRVIDGVIIKERVKRWDTRAQTWTEARSIPRQAPDPILALFGYSLTGWTPDEQPFRSRVWRAVRGALRRGT